MKISSKIIFTASPVFVFLISSLAWYLILYQIISFLTGFIFLIFTIFLAFWQNFLAFRKSGELIGLKSKKQIIIISTIFVLAFSELIWSISFLPFSLFILSGIISILFLVVLDIYKEYFRYPLNNDFKINKILIRDAAFGIILILIFIFISPWFPPKTY